MGKRYAVLDAAGEVVNHILVDDPLPAKYWPGYGKTLVPLEECDCSAGAALDIVRLKVADIPQIGDKLHLTTGVLTKFQPVVTAEGASAPAVKLAADVDPTTTKTITDRSATEIKAPKDVGDKAAQGGGK